MAAVWKSTSPVWVLGCNKLRASPPWLATSYRPDWPVAKTIRPFSPQPAPPKVVTIANGLTVAQDGTGQCESIGEALDKVKAGETIRVLDAATYVEDLELHRPGQHQGITLEAVKGATN